MGTPRIRIANDNGRKLHKAAISNSKNITIPSGVASISETLYERAIAHDESGGMDFISWNGGYYALGEQAVGYGERHTASTAERYSRDRMGLAVANMVMRFFKDMPTREIDLDVIVSHPPLDSEYKDLLKECITGDWVIQNQFSKWYIHIERVITYDEPLAILMNSLLTVDGRSYLRQPENPLEVIDFGGETIDFAATLPTGRLDTSKIRSEHLGINNLLRNFMDEVRKNNASVFKSAVKINPTLVQDAFRTGVFNGGKTIDCHIESKRFKNQYLADVQKAIAQNTDGLINYRTVILGGGGAALFQRELLGALDHDSILFADDNLDNITTAGVRGMLKVANLLEASGKL